MIVTAAAIIVVLAIVLAVYFTTRRPAPSSDDEWPKERYERREWEVEDTPDVKSYTIERVDGEEENIRGVDMSIEDGVITFERMDGYRVWGGRYRDSKDEAVVPETTQHEVSFVRDNVVRVEEDDWFGQMRFITVSGTVHETKESEDAEWVVDSWNARAVEEVLIG